MPRPRSLNPPQADQSPQETARHHPNASDRLGSPRVLLIRPSALGDVARTVSALVTLRRAMPDAKIDWLVNDAFADAVRHHPAIDEVIPFPRKRFAASRHNPRVAAESLAWSRRLRSRRYDIAIDLQGLFRSGVFTWMTGAKQRVGFANAREMAWLCYNHRHRVDRRYHTVDRMLALIEAAGYAATEPDMRLYLGPADAQWLDGWRASLGDRRGYVCIAPTARWRCKCWPIENYTRLAQHLLETGVAGDRLVVLASPDERDQLQPLRKALGDTPGVVYPETTVGQLMAILSQTRLLVCNDSAPLHIAVGFDRSIVSIFGPTDPALVGPYRRDDSVVQPLGMACALDTNYRRYRDDQSVISQVSPEAVWDKVLEQIKRDEEPV